MKKVLLFMLGVLVSLPMFARDFTYSYWGTSLEYTVIDEDAKTCMTKAGHDTGYYWVAGNKVSGTVRIPSKAKDGDTEYTVISIGDYAFYDTGLTSVTIPNTVTSIGGEAFRRCSLTSIEIPGSVTSIGWYAFYDCWSLTKAEFTSMEALCSIKFAGEYANPLYYAHNLYINGEEVTQVVIPNTVTSIGDYAFSGGTNLTSVEIPTSVNSIGTGTFYKCSGLTSVTIPTSVNTIGERVFYGCSGLTSVAIPGSVTSIGDYTFYNCSGLTSVTIPTSVNSIGVGAFSGCSGLTSVIIPNSVTSIGNNAFSGCSGLTSVEIPTSVTSIGNGAFHKCIGLTSVEIPNSVTSIGDHAFSYCSGLTSVTIPNSVSSIGQYAFFCCYGVTSMAIPASVKTIGSQAFMGCMLTKVEFASIESLCSIKFEDNLSNPLSFVGNLYINGEKITRVVIPNTVTSIGNYAFYECFGLTSVEIPGSVTSIGSSAFGGCSGLREVSYNTLNPVSANSNIFSEGIYASAKLYIPEPAYDAFVGISPWKNFKNMEPYKFTGIEEVSADIDETLPYEIYNLSGVKVADSTTSLLAPGLYIRKQGPKTQKFIVK